MTFIGRTGGKLWLTGERYAELEQEWPRLMDYQIDQAVNDGYEVGVFDVRVNAAGLAIVELLSNDIDAAIQQTKSAAMRGWRS